MGNEIKSLVKQLLFLPGFLCLDAPLVATGWASLVCAERGESEGVAFRVLVLFLVVWLIYLVDRLFDTRGSEKETPASFPPRHRFARSHRRLLAILALLVGISLLPLLAGLDPFVVRAGSLLGLAVAGYFLLFRILRRHNARSAPGKTKRVPFRLPWKEFVIAACFSSGVLLAADGIPSGAPDFLIGAGLFFVFLANCLVISKAEAVHDAVRDPMAFFSATGKTTATRTFSRRLIPSIAILASLAGLAILLAEGAALTGASVIMASIGLVWLARLPDSRRDVVQPAGDAILLLPWILLAMETAAS
jgi:hypothetical protein